MAGWKTALTCGLTCTHGSRREADKHFGGDWVKAAAAILTAAHAAEQTPEDPWAGLTSRIRSRTR
jgi:hypothetical protein